jgi:hypothetical protein
LDITATARSTDRAPISRITVSSEGNQYFMVMEYVSGRKGERSSPRPPPLSASNHVISRVTSPIDSHYGALHGAAL